MIVQLPAFKCVCDRCGRDMTLYDAWIGKPTTNLSATMEDAAVGAIARGWAVGVSSMTCTNCTARDIFGDALDRQPEHSA